MHDDDYSYYNSVVSGVKRNRIIKNNSNKSYNFVKNQRKLDSYNRRNNALTFRERSGDRLRSSSYWFDFSSKNFTSFIVLFILLVCISKAVLWTNSLNPNPFEDVISTLQEFSSMGIQAKNSMVSFVKSLQSIGNSTEILGDHFIFNNTLTRLLSSIAYSLSAIFNFLVFIIRCIWVVLRSLVGA